MIITTALHIHLISILPSDGNFCSWWKNFSAINKCWWDAGFLSFLMEAFVKIIFLLLAKSTFFHSKHVSIITELTLTAPSFCRHHHRRRRQLENSSWITLALSFFAQHITKRGKKGTEVSGEGEKISFIIFLLASPTQCSSSFLNGNWQLQLFFFSYYNIEIERELLVPLLLVIKMSKNIKV